MTCEHLQFEAKVGVARITDDKTGRVTNFNAEIEVNCKDCGCKFEFVGNPVGFSPYRPTTDLSSLKLNAPITPEGIKVPQGLPGYSVKIGNKDN